MPFTSSVFPVPRSPSIAMMSPGSRTCPRRRPSSRVSATDVVSTKVFIPGPFEPFHPRAVAEPNPGSRVNLAHHGQRDFDALEHAPGHGDACRRCRADQLEVLGILDGERPFLPRQTSRQWESREIERRTQARDVQQSLDLAIETVADV